MNGFDGANLPALLENLKSTTESRLGFQQPMGVLESDFEGAAEHILLVGISQNGRLLFKGPLSGQKTFLADVPFLFVQVEIPLFAEPMCGDGGQRFSGPNHSEVPGA